MLRLLLWSGDLRLDLPAWFAGRDSRSFLSWVTCGDYKVLSWLAGQLELVSFSTERQPPCCQQSHYITKGLFFVHCAVFLETLSCTFLPDIAQPLFVPHLCPAICLNCCKYKAWRKEALSENRTYKKTETHIRLKGVKRGERLSNPCCSGISEKR